MEGVQFVIRLMLHPNTIKMGLNKAYYIVYNVIQVECCFSLVQQQNATTNAQVDNTAQFRLTSILKCSYLGFIMGRYPAKSTKVVMGMGYKASHFMGSQFVTNNSNKDYVNQTT